MTGPDETPDQTSPDTTDDVPPANPGYATPPPDGIPDAEG